MHGIQSSDVGNVISADFVLEICQLCSLLQEAVWNDQFRSGFMDVRATLLWAWAVWMLRAFGISESVWQRKWVAFLQIHGFKRSSYSMDRLRWNNVSYVNLPTVRSKAYGGSTGKRCEFAAGVSGAEVQAEVRKAN